MLRITIGSLWVRFVSIVSLVFIVAGLYFGWGVPLDTVLGTTTLLLLIFIIVAISLNIGPFLLSIDRTLKDIREILGSKSGQSYMKKPESEEEEVKTTGAGALAGMAAGGLIGLIGGPVGVIIGGLLGALARNQLEYESIKAERKKGART